MKWRDKRNFYDSLHMINQYSSSASSYPWKGNMKYAFTQPFNHGKNVILSQFISAVNLVWMQSFSSKLIA